EFAQLGDNANRDKDFALGGDIDLSDTGTAWTGPDGYIGHFYGNGYTIKGLMLDGSTQSVGLFRTLGDGAIVENFTLEVSTFNDQPVTVSHALFIGGLLGSISNANGSMTIKGVTVKGDIKIGVKTTATTLEVGGLIGELSQFKEILIENCVSELNITADLGDAPKSYSAFGGFMGKEWNSGGQCKLTIRNSYATGNINVTGNFSSTNTNNHVFAGGFIGDECSNTTNTEILIEQCYAAGNISIASLPETTVHSNYMRGTGGFIGMIWKQGSGTNNVTIKNSAAVGSSVILNPLSGGHATVTDSSRFAGYALNTYNIVTFENNIANSGMLVGDGTSTHSDDSTDAQGTTKWGRGVANTTAGLKNSTTWTTAAPTGLGWSADTWDFSTVPSLGRPLLKK
ncbi:MAG: hypothetical protein LBG74_00825, partial [Spirochaetaceae bacterium]|nr:hypothetical protein [Spirochaetaceae bacterium]